MKQLLTLKYLSFAIGCVAMIVQLILMRELLAVFSGNELIIGTILANWLLISGFTALLSKSIKRISFFLVVSILFFLAIYQPVSILLIRYIKGELFPGISFGFTTSFLFSFSVLLPFCIASALVLASIPRLSFNERKLSVPAVYFCDTMGALFGSVLFTLFLSSRFSSLQIALMLSIILLHSATILLSKKIISLLVSFIGFIAISFLLYSPRLLLPLELKSIASLYPQQKIIDFVNTPYGQLVFTVANKQLTVFQNGSVAGAANDYITAEELIHYPLSQHPAPKTVLLVSGGLTGALLELSKYHLDRIDYIDLDLSVIRAVQDLSKNTMTVPVSWIQTDGIRFLTHTKNQYDLIIIATPPPDSAQANRYYTKEFFEVAKSHLHENGILSFSLPRSENYISDTYRFVASSIYNSLGKVFHEIKVVPGQKLYFIASENDMLRDIAASLKYNKIYTTYVNENYLNGILTKDRLQNIEDAFSYRNIYNTSYHPITYLAQIKHWLSQFGDNLLIPGILLFLCGTGIIFIIYLSPARSYYAAFSATSLVTMGLELLLLIALQVTFGALYQQTGLLFGAFMLGVALGSYLCAKSAFNSKQVFSSIEFVTFISCLILGVVFKTNITVPSMFIFYALTALCGFLVGGQFASLCKHLVEIGNSNSFISGSTFAIDFIAAAIGALVVSTLLIPVFGLGGVAFILAGIKLLSYLYFLIANIENKNSAAIFSHLITLLLFLGFGLAVYFKDSNAVLFPLSFHPWYQWTVFVLFVLGIVSALKLSKSKFIPNFAILASIKEKTNLSLFRWLCYFGLGGVVFYPIFRCFFKVPYLFCHGCPAKCIFGHLRPYIIPAALTINLEKRHWCYNMCPLGTLQECQAQANTGKKSIKNFIKLLPYAALLFTIFSYIQVENTKGSVSSFAQNWYNYFFKFEYSMSYWVVSVAIVLLALGYIFRRSFCSLFCPVGACSDLILIGERKASIIVDGKKNKDCTITND